MIARKADALQRRACSHRMSAEMSPLSQAWSVKLTKPLPTRDGLVLRSLDDARSYILALPGALQHREHWQNAASLLMDAAGGGGNPHAVQAATKQVELALFLDARLLLAAKTTPRERLAPMLKKKPPASSVRKVPSGTERPKRGKPHRAVGPT
jgi:hypothetical protein